MPGLRAGTSVVAVVPAALIRSAPVPATGLPSGPSSVSDELAGSIASVKVSTTCGGDVVMLALAAGTELTSSAWPNATPCSAISATRATCAATSRVRRRSAGSVLREKRVIAVALEPAAAHHSERGNHHRFRSARRHDAGEARPDLLRALHAQQREEVAYSLGGRLAFPAHRDQHVGLVLQGIGIVGFRSIQLSQERWDGIEPGIRVGPAHEVVERSSSALVMSCVELLQVALALCLRPGQRDLGDLAHLRCPSSQRFDELAQGEGAWCLCPKPVFMGGMHGPVYYRPCVASPARRSRLARSPWTPHSARRLLHAHVVTSLRRLEARRGEPRRAHPPRVGHQGF